MRALLALFTLPAVLWLGADVRRPRPRPPVVADTVIGCHWVPVPVGAHVFGGHPAKPGTWAAICATRAQWDSFANGSKR
jgi:hypothetical protein